MPHMHKPDGNMFIVSEFVIAATELSPELCRAIIAYVLEGESTRGVNFYTSHPKPNIPRYDRVFALAPKGCQGGVTQNADWIALGGYYGIIDQQVIGVERECY